MTTITVLDPVTDILDTDLVMVTNAQGRSYTIAGSELNKRNNIIIAENTTVTGAPLKAGRCVRIYFDTDITANDGNTVMQINYNGVNYYVKVPKDGTLSNFVAHAVGNTYKYVQAHTTLEFLVVGNQQDGFLFVIIGNPVVISNNDYSIQADGSIAYNGFTDLLSEIEPAEGVTLANTCNITKHNGVVSIYINFTLTNTFTKNDVLFTFSEKLRSRLGYIEVPCFLHTPDTFMGFLRFQFSALNILPNDQTMAEGTYRFTANYLAYDCTI